MVNRRTRHRINLWLASEQAWGLDAVARPGAIAVAQQTSDERSDPSPHVQARPSPARAAPVASEPGISVGAASPATLFVSAEPAPGLPGISPTGPFTSPVLPTQQRHQALAAMDANEVKGCTRCRLCQNRTQTVFGEGNPDARIFFIGEGPGENEDLQGRPFVGRAGDLLNRMIGGMGFQRDQVYIANIVKCRPPGNRTPQPDEVASCTPYLERQLEIVRPHVIVTLGLPATQYMLQRNIAIGRARGQWYTWRGIKLMPTYHPAYVLRSYTRQVREAVWSDLQKVLVELGLPVPQRRVQD